MKKVNYVLLVAFLILSGTIYPKTTVNGGDAMIKGSQLKLMSKIFFIKGSNGVLMIDAGLSEKDAKKALSHSNITVSEITHLVLTHAHQDHYGGAAYIIKESGSQVIAHNASVPILAKGDSETLIAHGFIGKVLTFLIPKHPVVPVSTDIVVNEKLDLHQYGYDAQLVHTPGHTDGSMSLICDNGEVLIGDLIRGKPGKISLGIWYTSKDQIIDSLRKISAFKPETIYFSHGGKISAEELKNFSDSLKNTE